MICQRLGGCLKERTKDWATPQMCSCEILEKLRLYHLRVAKATERSKHLSDIELINQNARGK